MKKSLILLGIVGLFSLGVFAQTPNFSGEWMLDKAKSKLDERQSASIEGQTLTAEQTDKKIKITVTTKQKSGGLGANQVDLGGSTNTYTFDGKEVTVESDSGIGKVLSRFKGELSEGKLKLQSIRTFNTAMGDVSLTTKESWGLSADGKTLTIKRESESQRGKLESEWVYARK